MRRPMKLPKGRFPRTILQQCRWDPDLGLDKVVVEHVHRGAPRDRAVVRGEDIDELGAGHFETAGSSIPYHRVTEIRFDGGVVFRREPRAPPRKLKRKG